MYAVDGDGVAPGWGAGGVLVVDVAVSGREVVGGGGCSTAAVAVGVGCTAVAPGWGGAGSEGMGSAVVVIEGLEGAVAVAVVVACTG